LPSGWRSGFPQPHLAVHSTGSAATGRLPATPCTASLLPACPTPPASRLTLWKTLRADVRRGSSAASAGHDPMAIPTLPALPATAPASTPAASRVLRLPTTPAATAHSPHTVPLTVTVLLLLPQHSSGTTDPALQPALPSTSRRRRYGACPPTTHAPWL